MPAVNLDLVVDSFVESIIRQATEPSFYNGDTDIDGAEDNIEKEFTQVLEIDSGETSNSRHK